MPYGDNESSTYYLTFPQWREIEADYSEAKISLLRLKEESSTLGAMADATLAQLEFQYGRVKKSLTNSVKFKNSLTSPIPPAIDRKKYNGLIAYRAWNFSFKGKLSPSIISGADTWAHAVAFSDKLPKEYNNHGLHATRLEAWRDNQYDNFISGLVSLHGTILEHADGILRAEYAQIACIFINITSDSEEVLLLTGAYENLKLTYPSTDIYIFTPYMKQLYIWREVLINYKMYQEGVY